MEAMTPEFITKQQSKESTLHNKNKINTDTISRLNAQGYELKIQEILEDLDIQERKTKETNEKNSKLLHIIKESELNKEILEQKLDLLNNDRFDQAKDIVSLNEKLLELNKKSKFQNEQTKQRFDVLTNDIKEKDLVVGNLKSKVEAKNLALQTAIVNKDYTSFDNKKLYEDNIKVKENNNKLQERINELESKLDEIYLTRKSESALLLEINHLKNDNIRLLNMLKTTDEFKDFAYLAEDCTGGIRYIKSDSLYSDQVIGKSKCGCSSKSDINKSSSFSFNKPLYPKTQDALSSKQPSSCRIKECVAKKIEENTPFNDLNWIPIEAFSATKTISSKYKLNIDDTIANELLYKLNLIWKERENKLVQRIKNKYQTEILDLRRKLNFKEPCDNIYLKSENKKLKDDIKTTKENNFLTFKKSHNDGKVIVDSALKVANIFNKNKQELEKEIERLKVSLDKKNNQITNDNFERLKFNEGAFWISKYN